MKIALVAARIGALAKLRAFVSHAVYVQMDEGTLTPLLERVVKGFPEVAVGSYPKWRDSSYKTKLTFDGRDEARVVEARDAFVALLPVGEPQKVD